MIAIDPGLGGTGYAAFDNTGVLRAAGVITAPRGAVWTDKIDYYARETRQKVDKLTRIKSTTILLEQAQFMQSEGGLLSARSGALVKLAVMTGAIYYALSPYERILVPASGWKGQLPKNVMVARVRKLVGKKVRSLGIKTHAFDAVGIGLWHLGKF
jgi:hypothetical protein